MMRKMAYVGIAYISGLFFASFFTTVINIYFLIAGSCIIISYFFCFKNRKKEFIVISISFCVAILFNIVYTKMIYENIIQFTDKEIVFEGKILDFSYKNNDKAFYILNGKINSNQKAKIIMYADSKQCQFYDKVIIKGTAKKLTNSISFPSEDYYKAKNIFLSIENVKDFEVIPQNKHILKREIFTYRDYIYNKIITILPGDEGAFLGAMLCGDKKELTPNIKTTLYRVGIGHIIAVSGTHLMIIAGIFLWIFSKFKINKLFRFFLIEGIILSFCVFSGLSPSVIRAAIMLTILMLGGVLKRKADTLNSIGMAGLLLTVASPYSIRDASLLLSLAGVFGIAVFAPIVINYLNIKGKLSIIFNGIISMICVSVCTLPFILLFFNEMSLISPIANLILAPFCFIALIFGFIMALFAGIGIIAYPALIVAGLMLKIVLVLSDFFADLPYSFIPIGYKFIFFSVYFSAITVIFILVIFKNKRLLLSSILISFLPLLMFAFYYQSVNYNKLKIALITQNNSTAMVLHKNGQVSIIDLEGKGKISEAVELYLNSKGIKNVSVLILNKNVQKNISSYYNNISAEIKKICYYNDEKIFFPNTEIEKICEDTLIEFQDYNITYKSNQIINIQFGKLNFDCYYGNNNFTYRNNETVAIQLNDNNKIIQYNNQTLLLDKKVTDNGEALLFVCNKNGHCNIRRLNYAFRE